MRHIPLVRGERHGRLTAVEFSHLARPGYYYWRFLCDCGNECVAGINSVRSGKIQSCGCLRRETRARLNVIHAAHGMSYSPEFGAWSAMLKRCTNPNHRSYRHYGGRGIKVCKRWLKFQNFYADMGPRPSSQHSLDRVDNNGNYEPENCRWATMKQQNQNKRNAWITSPEAMRNRRNGWITRRQRAG